MAYTPVDDCNDGSHPLKYGNVPCSVLSGRVAAICAAVLTGAVWIWQRLKCHRSSGTEGWVPTLELYYAFYAYEFATGFDHVVRAIVRILLEHPPDLVIESLASAVAWYIGPCLVLAVGRMDLFRFAAHRFDKKQEREESPVCAKMESFLRSRRQQKRRKFNAVIGVGVRLFALGSLLLSVCTMADAALGDSKADALQYTLIFAGSLCVLIMSGAVVVFLTLPSNLMEMDRLWSKRPRHRAAVGGAFAVCTFAKALFSYPHASLMSTFFAVWLIFRGGRCGTACPQCSTLLVMVALTDLMAHGLSDLFESKEEISGSFSPWWILGSDKLGGSILLGVAWYWKLCQYDHTDGVRGLNPTSGVYFIFFGYFGTYGLSRLLRSVCLVVLEDQFAAILESSLLGVAWLAPLLVLLAVGPKHLFNYVADRFDTDPERLAQAGAFIAELLTSTTLEEGHVWWVHRKDNEKDHDYAETDHRHHWRCGRIVELSATGFVVEVPILAQPKSRSSVSSQLSVSSRPAAPECFERVPLPLAHREIPSTQLLATAHANFRCIDWKNISKELMTRNIPAGAGSLPQNLFDLSRPVRKDEVVDYFMSHGWYDDVDVKWQQLQRTAAKFQQKTGRAPTFWLDKVCIDQNDIGDGLKVLSVNVMQCKKMLVLCGHSYPHRLWCVWELCTLMSFTTLEQAMERVELLTLNTNPNDDILGALARFDHAEAHCYDPNEERRLRSVIDVVGGDHFNLRIQTLAEELKHGQMHML